MHEKSPVSYPDCSTCPMQSKIRPGMDYWQSPCSACSLKKDDPMQKKQIIRPEGPARLIKFIDRLLFVVRSERRRRILYDLLRHPGSRDSDIAARLNLPRRNVSYHTRIIRQTLPELLHIK